MSMQNSENFQVSDRPVTPVTPDRIPKALVVPLPPKKIKKRLFDRIIKDGVIVDFIILDERCNLCGKTPNKDIRKSMTKTEWFSKLTQDQKNKITEIGYFYILEDLEMFFDDIRIPVNKDEIPAEFQNIVNEVSHYNDIFSKQCLLRIGNIIDDGKEWLSGEGEN
jgi:hypothetical protein